nr:hypothetical protein [Tanacetum cinerariifolium]
MTSLADKAILSGADNRPPMLEKDMYDSWKSIMELYMLNRQHGRMILESFKNGPLLWPIVEENGVTKQKKYSELSATEAIQADYDIEADDQAIQTILLGLPEDIYAAVDSCKTAQEIWLGIQQMMKGSDIGIHEKKAKNKHFLEKIVSNLKFLNNLQPEWSRHVTIVHQTKDLHTADYTQLYEFLKYNQKEVDELKNYLQQPMPNPKDITDPTTAMNMALALMAKAFKLNYSPPTNNSKRMSSNPRNRQIAQPGMNIGQDRKMQMVGGNGGNQFRNQNQIGNGNLVAARPEGNAAGQNGNQIRCYNCRGVCHYARNCTVRPKRRDAAYLQTQLLIAQKEEAGIQLQAEEYDLMAAAADLDEIKEVNANFILMANLQQASTSGTQTDSAPVYDSDGSAEMVGDNGRNQFRQYARQNAGNLNGNQVTQNPRVQNDGIQNQIGNDLDEIEEVNANCILMANLQQASSSATQNDSTLVYDSDGSAK